jgi:hypothetical protein
MRKIRRVDFHRRALWEADRYGSDSWVFLRELLQNARDAGAGRVEVKTEALRGTSRLSCQDDGAGMTLEHARRYLFTLYASSKDQDAGSAGRFGVGFWSVLRFRPAHILVRSWPSGGRAWEIALAGDLSTAAQGLPPPRRGTGTEVILERPDAEPDLARAVFEAAWREARYLCRRDDPERRLLVMVNGRAISAAFDLPPPSARFRRGASRGVVALGATPGVELFAKGLHVRAATTLGDLVAPSEASQSLPTLAQGLAPRVLLDGGDLDLLLARGDARTNRALMRLVRLAQRELERLLGRQLDLIRPQSLGQRVWEVLGRRTLLAIALMAAAVVGAGALRLRDAPSGAEAIVVDRPSPIPYRDLAGRYHGPEMDRLAPSQPPIALVYAPRQESPRFAALLVDRLEASGRAAPFEAHPVRPYAGSPCAKSCLEVELLAEGPGPIRLPIPTGHRLDPDSVLLDGRRASVLATETDQPVLELAGASPRDLRYRTGPAVPPPSAPAPSPPLPAGLADVARELRSRPLPERVSRLLGAVQDAVAYSTDDAFVMRHRAAAAAGQPFIERTLAVGAGDCDIQNGLLMLLFQAAGVPARLAVGYLGNGGHVAPSLHAWVEYRDGSGPWRIADASTSTPVRRGATVAMGGGLEAPYPALSPRPESKLPATMPPANPSVFPRSLALGLSLLIASGAGLRFAHRTRRSVRLDHGQHLPRLLLGALQHPDGFGPGSVIFHHRLLPLFPRGRLALGEAWDLAARGRLYSTRAGCALARRLARRLTVVDASQPEGATVSDTLGAVDLDSWDAVLARSRTGPLLDALNAYLRHRGEGWSFRTATAAGADHATLRLASSWLGWRPAPRIVVLDETLAWLRAAEELWEGHPAEALFTAADRALDLIEPSARDRSLLLAPLARAALLEAAP